MLLLCLFSSLICTPVRASDIYTDVKNGDWFYNEVNYAYEQGLMNGVGDGRFDPEGTTTRAMIVTILYRLSGDTGKEYSYTFRDLEAGAYYENAVAWAAAKGVVQGYSAKEFGPNDLLTREQIATILFRYAKLNGYDISASGALDRFSDGDQIGDYAVAAMDWCNGVELIKGTSATTLSPKGSASRAQVAVILYRFCKMYVEEKSCSICFLRNDGTADPYLTVTAKKGEMVEAPASPTRTDYEFLGWYPTAQGGTMYTFPFSAETDLTLYARWKQKTQQSEPTEKTVTITFALNYPDAGVYAVKQTKTTDSLTEPAMPERFSYRFLGWYTAASGGTKVSFPGKFSEDTTVYAHWSQDLQTKQDNVFLLTGLYDAEQKTVTVELDLTGEVSLCGFDMRISYPKELVKLKELDEIRELPLVASSDPELGLIRFNYAVASNITEDRNILSMTFDVIGDPGEYIYIELLPVEVIKTDAAYDIYPAESSQINWGVYIQ